MIIWFTGQPGAGKTELAKLLKRELEANRSFFYKVHHIDGDDLRELTFNKDYSTVGRVRNVETAQKIAHYLHNNEYDVIVSLVSPYIDQREEFKKIVKDNILEVYVHTKDIRGRENYHVEGYQPPLSNFISIDTTNKTPNESLIVLKNEIQSVCRSLAAVARWPQVVD